MTIDIFSNLSKTDSRKELKNNITELMYFKDAKEGSDFDEIRVFFESGKFYKNNSNTLAIGLNASKWWIAIDLQGRSIEKNSYLSINNPTVASVSIFVPVKQNDVTVYEKHVSGWSYYSEDDDIDFNYPVFKLSNELDTDSVIYINLYSPFTQNYNIGIWNTEDMRYIMNHSVMNLFTFIGLLIAIAISNVLIFITLKDKTYLFHVIYVFMTISYNGALLGYYRLFAGRLAEALVSHVVSLGLIMIISLIFFFKSFYNTKKEMPVVNKILDISFILCSLVAVLMFLGLRYYASIASTYIGFAIILFMWGVIIYAVLKKISQAGIFLAAWTFILLGAVIFALRVLGYIPNSNLTLNIVLICSMIETLLMSWALSDRIRILRMNKEHVDSLYEDAEKSAKINEIAFLQAQIKPHFLFNVLNVIASLCRLDIEKAREMILDLSEYLRYSFDFKNLDRSVSIQEELEFVEKYVKIEQARFKDKFDISYELDDVSGLWISPLTIQPLVENSVRHGIRKKKDTGNITVRIKRYEGYYSVEVKDDGEGIEKDKLVNLNSDEYFEGQGTGLYNINRRLNMLYGSRLWIFSESGKGTKVTFSIPINQEVNDVKSSDNRR